MALMIKIILLAGMLTALQAACRHLPAGNATPGAESSATRAGAAPSEDFYRESRQRMVREQIKARGVADARVLAALESVPRHLFVPPAYADLAYEDSPLPIGLGQTISQPYIVALMTEEARTIPSDRVLEVGTGSGYQAAVLATLVREVYTIELLPELGRSAAERLKSLGCANVHCRIGDGYQGWPEAAPFDAILVTAAAEEIPPALLQQLRPGGRLIIPVGREGGIQELIRLEKDAQGKVHRSNLIPVRFVPLVHGR